MKILRVISSVNPVAGGPINGLINSSKELISMGHQVEVLTLDDPLADWVNNFEFPLVTFKGYLGTFSYSRSFSHWLDNNVAKFDVVVIHGLWQFHSFATAKSCINNKIPYIIFTHGMLDPWFNLNSNLKVIKKNIYWKLFEQFVINNAGRVLFTSEEECQLARQSFAPYSASERVVAYGCPQISGSKHEPTDIFYSSYPELLNKCFGLYLSRIHPKKGIDLLIDAIGNIKDLPNDFVLAIAGPDNKGLRAKLEIQISRLGIDNKVVWLGMLSGDVKWGAFNAADFFILPSHQENFGIVVAEALSTATPVLITNKVNIWREIQSAGAGLVANDDVPGIEAILKQWFALSILDKEIISKQAALCYQNNFSIQAAASDLENVLLEMVNINKELANVSA